MDLFDSSCSDFVTSRTENWHIPFGMSIRKIWYLLIKPRKLSSKKIIFACVVSWWTNRATSYKIQVIDQQLKKEDFSASFIPFATGCSIVTDGYLNSRIFKTNICQCKTLMENCVLSQAFNKCLIKMNPTKWHTWHEGEKFFSFNFSEWCITRRNSKPAHSIQFRSQINQMLMHSTRIWKEVNKKGFQ